MLWGEKNTANKYHWHVQGMLAVYGPHGVCPSSQWHELSQSLVLRLQVALQRNCPKWALGFVHFPGLSCSGSGSWVLHKGIDSVECAFCAFRGPSTSSNQVLGKLTVLGRLCVSITSLVPATWSPGCATRVPSQVCCVSPLGR